MIGVVRRVIRDRAFGFADHKGEDLFFHRSDFFDPKDYDTLEPGDLIEYEILSNSTKRKAVEIIFAKPNGGR